MKFTATSALSALAVVASAKAEYTRCETGRTTVTEMNNKYQPWANQLYSPCVSGAKANGSDFWARRACVAGAIAMGPRGLVNYATCDKASLPVQNKMPYLDYATFASIVGDCAYSKKACGVTRQNLVDLVYGELDAAKAKTWPSGADELKADLIEPVFTWAGHELSSITYSRFNEWLQIADWASVIGNSPSGKEYFYDHEEDAE